MRQSWTDDRLDDLARRMDLGFAQVREDIAGLRAGQERLTAECVRGTAIDRRFDAVDRRFEALDARFDRLQATIVGGFVSILAALIALHFT